MNDDFYQTITKMIKNDPEEGIIKIIGELRRVNRPEDGYQPSCYATLFCTVNGSPAGEIESLAENERELQRETRNELDHIVSLLIDTYLVRINNNSIQYKK
ncbi:hypothetical protein J4228_02635 [Candidatus Woesearchaeota archaeon]|nr:hypothetical protein [Candidatus Woesearchaeota archaeon]